MPPVVKPNEKIEFIYKNKIYELEHGSIVMASIMSYTSLCNPLVMLAAGLLARKALLHGLRIKPYILCEIWPGSGLLTKNYLIKSGLIESLHLLGYNPVSKSKVLNVSL